MSTPPSSPDAGAELLPTADFGLTLGRGIEGVCLELKSPEAVLQALGAEHGEVPGAPGAVPKRRAEFAAGRYAAALALARLGIRGEVNRNSDGSPEWPSGVVGSISHGANRAVAVATRVATQRGLGVDFEALKHQPVALELASRIASDAEFSLLANALPLAEPGSHFTLLFSAKESLFKCLFPLARRFMDFSAARLVRVAAATASSGVLRLRLERAWSEELEAGLELDASFWLAAGHVETLVCLDHRV